MIKALEAFQKSWADPYKEAKAWKEATKGKVIGWFPMYAPEELIHAAGALPVYLRGRHEPVTLGNKCMENFVCPPLRLMADSLLKGYFDVVDGLLFVKTCDEEELTAAAIDLLSVKPWLHPLRRPHTLTKPLFQESLIKEIQKAKNHIEELVDHTIDDESLRQSISTYNTNRSLLRYLYELRRKNPGLLNTNEIRAVVGSSMVIPKEKHNKLLEAVIHGLTDKKSQREGIKVVLAGGICGDPEEGVFDTIDEVGMVVAEDELFIGGRYFDTDISINGQPVEALARYHWQKSPCPCSLQTERRAYAPYLIEMVKRCQAQAIIELEWKFCAYQSYERPYLSEAFAQAGISYLKIDLAEESLNREALRSRLEAFMETTGLKEE